MKLAAPVCAVVLAAALTAATSMGKGHATALSPAMGSAIEQTASDGATAFVPAQYRRGGAGPRAYGPRAYGPRAYGPRAYGPRAYGPPRVYGPPRRYAPPRAYAPRYYGRPGFAYRPWYRRPYYGTIIGGIALGSIIGAAAYGLAPRPPSPDVCWFWADEIQSQGYWDYC